jgi:hypothetical protein
MPKNIAQKLAAATKAKAETEKAQKAAKSEAKLSAAERAKKAEAFRQAKAEKTAEARKEYAGLLYHNVTVTGGKRIELGTEGECIWIGVNRRFLSPLASFVTSDGKREWINPDHLTAGEPLSKARKAVLEAEAKEESEATVLIDGTVLRQGDKGVTIRHSGFFKDMSFALTMVEKVGEMPNGTPIFEVPAWKVRQEVGQIAVDALNGKREEYEKHIG